MLRFFRLLACLVFAAAAIPALASDGTTVLTTSDVQNWVPLVAMLVTGGIAWGIERQSRKDLEARHNETAREVRSRLGTLEARNAVQEKEISERTSHLNTDIVALRARVDATVEALARLDVKQERDREDIMHALEKLSDSVQSLRSDLHSVLLEKR